MNEIPISFLFLILVVLIFLYWNRKLSREVDERIRSENALRRSEDELRAEYVTLERLDRVLALHEERLRLGEVSGVVFRHPEERTLYLAGDTIWNDHVAGALEWRSSMAA